eukprot:356436-Chlamydomonas_euryale.AAC.1
MHGGAECDRPECKPYKCDRTAWNPVMHSPTGLRDPFLLRAGGNERCKKATNRQNAAWLQMAWRSTGRGAVVAMPSAGTLPCMPGVVHVHSQQMLIHLESIFLPPPPALPPQPHGRSERHHGPFSFMSDPPQDGGLSSDGPCRIKHSSASGIAPCLPHPWGPPSGPHTRPQAAFIASLGAPVRTTHPTTSGLYRIPGGPRQDHTTDHKRPFCPPFRIVPGRRLQLRTATQATSPPPPPSVW